MHMITDYLFFQYQSNMRGEVCEYENNETDSTRGDNASLFDVYSLQQLRCVLSWAKER